LKHLPDVARCDAYWAREDMDRPLLSAWVGTWSITDHYPHAIASLPNGELRPDDLDFEKFRPDYENLFASHQGTGADTPWAAFPLMLVPWVEAIISCPIHHRDGNIWATPWLNTYERPEEIELKANNPWLERLLEFTDWLVKLSDGRFPISTSLMRGPLDLLVALRGAERTVLDIFDYPQELDEILHRLTDIWVEVAHAQLARIPAFERGYNFGQINLWTRKPCGWFQDDAVAIWSPKYYRRHLRSYEERLSRCMEVTGIHLHPGPLFVIEDLLTMPDLDVIEINLDDNGPRVPDLIPHFKQVLEKKNLIIWGDFSREDLLIMRENLPTRGLALQIMADTAEKVRAQSNNVRRIWHK
jgi:hypothetical protein